MKVTKGKKKHIANAAAPVMLGLGLPMLLGLEGASVTTSAWWWRRAAMVPLA